MKKGYTTFFIPHENIYELEYIPNIVIFPLKTFSELANYFILNKDLSPIV